MLPFIVDRTNNDFMSYRLSIINCRRMSLTDNICFVISFDFDSGIRARRAHGAIVRRGRRRPAWAQAPPWRGWAGRIAVDGARATRACDLPENVPGILCGGLKP